MSDNTIPEYLQPALAQLEKARAAHLENARLMDETVTAIERAEQEKNALAQADGNDADDWRTAFRAAGGVLSDELKQRHIERVARRELVQEYDNLAVVLNFERERLKGACDSTATAYRKAHHHLLSLYAEHELEHALNETCEALVRAMHLSILAQENPLANRKLNRCKSASAVSRFSGWQDCQRQHSRTWIMRWQAHRHSARCGRTK